MPMQSPLVSILMPYRNTAAYLPECLDSLLSQRYTHWELHAVDDHSEDSSPDLLAHYARKDSRLKVHKNRGKGIIPALRKAFKNSRGLLITRMDSDDIMHPDKLGFMAESLQKKGRGHLAVGGVEYFSHRGISAGYRSYESWLNKLTATGSNYSELYKECVIPSPCWMVYRDDLLAAGGFEPDRYPEDYDLTFRFYECGLTPIPCTIVLHRWRDYDERTSRNHEHYAQNYFLDIKLYYFLRLHYDASRPLTVWGAGFKGKEIAKGLQKQLVPFHWYCDNPNKIGKKIYGESLVHYEEIRQEVKPQCIITVANTDAQREIRSYLTALGMRSMADYFFFC